MRPVLAPALLRVLRLLLPLAICGWGPAVASPIWNHPNELMHLYTSNSRSYYHLQINPNGQVDGTPTQTIYSAVVFKTVGSGLVSIIGAKSELYLCMYSDGKLYATNLYNNDCVFQYHLLENYYDVYESPKHHLLVSLGSDKRSYIPYRKLPPFSQFLPRRNEIDLSKFKTSRRQ